MSETVKSVMRKASARAAGRGGRLILVTCADIGRLDLVLRAAVRRMPASHAIEMAEPVVTRPLPTGSGTVVSRSGFSAIDETGDIVLAWHDGGRSFGYTTRVIEMLERGGAVVAGAPSGCGADIAARSLWPDVVVVHIEPGTEKLRNALGAMASVGRTAPPLVASDLRDQARDVRIHDLGDLSAAVRALTMELDRLCPKAVMADKQPRAAIATPSQPRRPGARSGLAATPRRASLERPLNAAARAPAAQVRALQST